MKIGIFTFHRAINYGAVLQCLSLKKYLESSGHIVDIIDYWPKYHAKDYELFKISSLVSFLYSLLTFRRKWHRMNKFSVFFNKYLKLDAQVKYKSTNELVKVDYDLLVYGSDQIWWYSDNLDKRGFDFAYWGEYVNKSISKVGYATSMGKNPTLNNEEKSQVIKMLSNFDSLNLREKSLQTLIHSLTGTYYPVVLDPVFLHDKSFWRSFSDKHSVQLPSKKYILFYDMLEDPQIVKKAEKISNLKNCELVYLTKYVRPFRYNKLKYYQTLSPFEFLYLLDHSDSVISSSFHGVAFSLIYNKAFYAISTVEKSNRIKSVLDLVNVEMKEENNIIYTPNAVLPNAIEQLIPSIIFSKKQLSLSIKEYA